MEVGSVGFSFRISLRGDSAADGYACSPVLSCCSTDQAAVVLSNRLHNDGPFRDGLAVCQSPTRETGQLHLQEQPRQQKVRDQSSADLQSLKSPPMKILS